MKTTMQRHCRSSNPLRRRGEKQEMQRLHGWRQHGNGFSLKMENIGLVRADSKTALAGGRHTVIPPGGWRGNHSVVREPSGVERPLACSPRFLAHSCPTPRMSNRLVGKSVNPIDHSFLEHRNPNGPTTRPAPSLGGRGERLGKAVPCPEPGPFLLAPHSGGSWGKTMSKERKMRARKSQCVLCTTGLMGARKSWTPPPAPSNYKWHS